MTVWMTIGVTTLIGDNWGDNEGGGTFSVCALNSVDLWQFLETKGWIRGGREPGVDKGKAVTAPHHSAPNQGHSQ